MELSNSILNYSRGYHTLTFCLYTYNNILHNIFTNNNKTSRFNYTPMIIYKYETNCHSSLIIILHINREFYKSI